MKSSYGEKLRSPKWQKRRLEILNRDQFTCRLCGDKESQLHVHHLRYEKGADPWDYNNGSLVTVCENCHDELHQVNFGESFLEAFIGGGIDIDGLYIALQSLDMTVNDGPDPLMLTTHQWATFGDSLYFLLRAAHSGAKPEEIGEALGALYK